MWFGPTPKKYEPSFWKIWRKLEIYINTMLEENGVKGDLKTVYLNYAKTLLANAIKTPRSIVDYVLEEIKRRYSEYHVSRETHDHLIESIYLLIRSEVLGR